MKHGGFAPWKKLKLKTDEPAVEIPPFFPKVITHLMSIVSHG